MNNHEIKKENVTEEKKSDRVTCCNSTLPSTDEISTIYKNKLLYFCEDECKEEFLENPGSFIESDHFLVTFENLENE